MGSATVGDARVRFISAEVADGIDVEGNPRLVERDNVVNPSGVMADRETFRDRATREPSGGGPHGAGPVSDDHREGSRAEDERRFARDVVARVRSFARAQGIGRLVLAAGPRLLGVSASHSSARHLARVWECRFAPAVGDLDVGKSVPCALWRAAEWARCRSGDDAATRSGRSRHGGPVALTGPLARAPREPSRESAAARPGHDPPRVVCVFMRRTGCAASELA